MNDKIKKIIEKWLESLDEAEKAQIDVLNAYFTYRTNMPCVDPGFGKAVEEPKTTEEIIDDLQPMISMNKDLVASYMRKSEYGFTTLADGSVKWAVWRFVDVTVLT